MKKSFTPEIKIAIVAILGIIILFFGLNFLKGLNLFSSNTHYNIKFDQITGISNATPVFVNGFKIGSVDKIDYNYNNPEQGINVSIAVDKKIKIPKDTRAEIVSSVMGDVKINLIATKSSNINYLAEGETIPGTLNIGIVGDARNIFPVIKSVLPQLDSVLININCLLKDPALAATLHNSQKISTSLVTSSQQLNTLLTCLAKNIPTVTNKVKNTLDNTNYLITNAGKGIKDTRSTIKEAKLLIANLSTKTKELEIKTTVTKLNEALENVNTLTKKLNSTDGTAGLILNDPSLYNNLNNTLKSVDSLVVNLKAHPKRYVHFSIFGRKEKK